MAVPAIEVYHKVTGQRTWMAQSALAIFTDYAAVPAPPALPPGPFDPFPMYLTEADAAAAIGGSGALGVAGRAASVAANSLALAANPDTLIAGTITRDSDGAATAAPVVWPDGATGAYTATTVSSAFPGAVDAYTITRVRDGVTMTFSQPAVTRDPNGAVSQRPALTVS